MGSCWFPFRVGAGWQRDGMQSLYGAMDFAGALAACCRERMNQMSVSAVKTIARNVNAIRNGEGGSQDQYRLSRTKRMIVNPNIHRVRFWGLNFKSKMRGNIRR